MKIINKPTLSTLAFFPLFLSGHSYAIDDELFFEMPVVLSASRMEQPASETPVAITSIDRQMIEASGARSIPDVLRLVPGIVIGHSVDDFGTEPRTVVAYHGHSDQFSRRMQVLIDGRSIYEPIMGGVAWNMLPVNIDDIERIEVTRGPNASTYGSNSFLAVINIITRHAAEDSGHYFRANIGNHDIHDGTYRYGGSEENLDYRITVATQNDNGQDRADDTDTHDDVGARAIDYRLDYQVNKNNQLTYQGGYSSTTQQADINFRDPQFRKQRDVDNVLAHQFLRWESNISSDESIVLQYYYNLLDKKDFIESNLITSLPFDPFIVAYSADQKARRHDVEFTHFLHPTPELRLVWGLSWQHDHASSDRIFNTDSTQRRNLFRGFSNIEIKLNQKNILNLGALLEKTRSEGSKSISPRAALIHKINHGHSLRFGVSKAIRTPFLIETDGNVVLDLPYITIGGGTPFPLTDQITLALNDLTPEKITSREIGYYGRFVDDDLLINARIFRDTLKDLIDSPKVSVPNDTVPNDGEAEVYDNLHSTTISGIEIELDYYYNQSTRFVGFLAYLDIRSNDFLDGKPREFQESAPDHSASLLAIKKFNDAYDGSIGFYYVGDMAWMDANRNTTLTKGFRNTRGYRKLDLRLARNFKIGNEKATIAFVLQNLLDDYSDYDSDPRGIAEAAQQNFTAYLELRAKFK